MKFDIITIFPNIFDSYFSESILARAQKEKMIDIEVHNLRDYTKDKHKTVDDTPYGGGAGMVMKIEPIFDCVKAIRGKGQETGDMEQKKTRVILFSAKGKKYTQEDAEKLKNYDNLILICGRYEGVDERVAEHVADEEISIGDYVLTGGEIPAMVMVDSISRLLPGVLGNPESLSEESFNLLVSETENIEDVRDIKDNIKNSSLKIDSKLKIQNSKFGKEYPQYTKPEEFNGWKIPEVLKSGNHEEIKKWREDHRAKVVA